MFDALLLLVVVVVVVEVEYGPQGPWLPSTRVS
eukprot:SAG31_NODE_26201_length_446_cov_1.109510_2_plen_32_part_01